MLQFSATNPAVPIAIASAPRAKALAISAPSLIPPANTNDISPVLPTSSRALLASLIAPIPGIPVLAAAMCGPAAVEPSIESKNIESGSHFAAILTSS